eukprot:SAG31_NODE_5800_length_2322_cov_15.403509_1_plen_205_part_00
MSWTMGTCLARSQPMRSPAYFVRWHVFTTQAYTNVAMMRQQFKPSWRVHGVIVDGGTEPNIIPATSTSRWYIRAPNMEDLAELHAKVEGCMVAAGQSTGCEPDIQWQGDHAIFDHDEYEQASRTYADIKTNPTMAELFRTNWDAQDTDLTFRPVEEDLAIASAGGGSSDMGNVTHIMPGAHICEAPFFAAMLASFHTFATFGKE